MKRTGSSEAIGDLIGDFNPVDLRRSLRMSFLTSLMSALVRFLCPSIYVLVVVNSDGQHDIVEIYSRYSGALARCNELVASGFSNQRISISARRITAPDAPGRMYGPKWKSEVGWSL